MKSAVNEALEHLEKQAVKYNTRWRSKKRHDLKKWNGREAGRSASRPRSDSLKEPRFRWLFTNFPQWPSPPKCTLFAPMMPLPGAP